MVKTNAIFLHVQISMTCPMRNKRSLQSTVQRSAD